MKCLNLAVCRFEKHGQAWKQNCFKTLKIFANFFVLQKHKLKPHYYVPNGKWEQVT